MDFLYISLACIFLILAQFVEMPRLFTRGAYGFFTFFLSLPVGNLFGGFIRLELLAVPCIAFVLGFIFGERLCKSVAAVGSSSPELK